MWVIRNVHVRAKHSIRRLLSSWLGCLGSFLASGALSFLWKSGKILDCNLATRRMVFYTCLTATEESSQDQNGFKLARRSLISSSPARRGCTTRLLKVRICPSDMSLLLCISRDVIFGKIDASSDVFFIWLKQFLQRACGISNVLISRLQHH